MNNKPKSKIGTILVLVFTVILAGIAIFTAIRLYQLRNQAVAPNVPSSIPHAAENTPPPDKNTCNLSFSLATSTGSPSPTGTPAETPSPTPTETPGSTPTLTPTATPTLTPGGTPNSCNGTCGSNLNCQSQYVCTNGHCRNPNCTSSTSCGCGTTSSTPTSAPSLPQSGTDWPTLAGAALGIIVIFGSLALAF